MTQVTEHLETRGVPFESIRHEQAYTSIAEAAVLGIDASEVVKTVAVRAAGGYALMAVPATCRLDMHLVQAAVGDRHVRLATEEELLRDFPGFALGALPPLGSLLGAPLYIDQEVLRHETVVFAAGSQTESVQIRTADLLQHEQATTLPLIKHADEMARTGCGSHGSMPAAAVYGRDMSHWCRSPASVAVCSGSIVPVVLPAPNTGLCHPHVQTAWTPPSPTW